MLVFSVIVDELSWVVLAMCHGRHIKKNDSNFLIDSLVSYTCMSKIITILLFSYKL